MITQGGAVITQGDAVVTQGDAVITQGDAVVVTNEPIVAMNGSFAPLAASFGLQMDAACVVDDAFVRPIVTVSSTGGPFVAARGPVVEQAGAS